MSEMLTEGQVNDVLNAWDYLDFSTHYKNTFYNSGYYTPDIVNQRMKDINMNPISVSNDELQKALKNPKSSEDVLRGYSQSMELQSMYYKRLMNYITNLASFNLSFDPINVEDESELSSVEFKDDLRILDNFCSKLDYNEEFGKVLKQLLRQEVLYSALRQDGDRYILQELPANFCKITGRFSHGLLFDFDMYWFIGNYGVDIDMYPKVFKKMYRDIFNKRKISANYDPAKPVDTRNSTFVYWHQCSPEDGLWAWKLSPEVATAIPFYSPLFPDLALQSVVRGLQTDKYFIQASKLLVGVVGFNKEQKSGQVQNQINMSPKLLGEFLGAARQGLARQIGLVALPVEEIEPVEFDTSQNNISIDHTDNIAKQSTAASQALFSDGKLISHQSKLASAIDSNFVKSLYPMFSNFVEFYVNQMTKKYKFRIRFHDTNTPDDREERSNLFKNFASMGLVDIQQAARVCDMNPFEFSRKLSMTKAFGLEDKLVSLMSLNNQVANKGETGRPADPNSDNDSTQDSIDRGSNDN